jgi:hypothetical protein
MKMRWAAALLLLTGLCVNRAWADGFGFTVANATVSNAKAAGNTDVTKAEVGDTFTITGAAFASYRSSGAAPAITDNDLARYSANLTGSVADITGTTVHYTGTFSIIYTGPQTTQTIATGSLDLHAAFGNDGSAVITGFLKADPKLSGLDGTPWANTDFSLYNPGRFYGVYKPAAGDYAHGSITASVNAGKVGFATSIEDSTVQNHKASGNNDPTHAQLGDTFTLAAPLASYYTIGGPPLTDNDLSRYSLTFNGTVVGISGKVVTYTGPFSLTYTGPAYPSGVTIETGSFTLTASYNDTYTSSAKLTATLVADAGYSTTESAWAQTDFAIFNPATFNGTYTPQGDGSTGIVSGSLIGGVLGFSTTIAQGDVVNSKAAGNTNVNFAEVGDPFHVSGNLAAYLAVGAPPLTDHDLNKYNMIIDGTVTSTSGTTVVYDGSFRITYVSGALSVSIESGTCNIVAVFDSAGNARLSGTLTAKAGADSALAPFNTTDYSAFNAAAFTGEYTRVATDHGTLRGGLTGGTLAVPIQSRVLGTAIEGSPTAAVQTNDARRAIVASGTTLFVLDPATGDDAPGWAGGKTLDGKVLGRAAVLKDDVYVGTDAGTIYRFNLQTGALVGSGQPISGGHIYSGLAVVDHQTTGEAVDQVVAPVFISGLNQVWLFKVAGDFSKSSGVKLGDGVISTSTPSVPQNGLIFVGTNSGLFTIRYSDLAIQAAVATPTPTAPLTVGGSVYVGTGTGSTFRKLNVATGATTAQVDLASPLMLGAFYEKQTGFIQAGTADGHIASFDNTGSFVGYTLPGLMNPDVTGGSQTMPVEANNVLYRATENKEILSGKPLNGDEQETIAVLSAIRGAIAVTGQTPGADYLIATSPDGIVHLIGVR